MDIDSGCDLKTRIITNFDKRVIWTSNAHAIYIVISNTFMTQRVIVYEILFYGKLIMH